MNNALLMHPTYLFWKGIINNLFKHEEISILDYGCGNGIILDLIDSSRIKKYLGYDTSADAVAVGCARYKDNKKVSLVAIKPKSRPNFGLANSHDLVILIGVFQYLEKGEIDHVIREAKRTLKKGGCLMFSTVLDDSLYKFINLYRFVFPNRYINRKKMESSLKKAGFKLRINQARGLIFGPLVSHGLVIPFDAIDHYIFGVRGKIGLLGKLVRLIAFPFMYLELLLPIDRGYTWYVVAEK